MPKIGMRQLAAPEQEAHKEGGVLDFWLGQLGTQIGVHAVAHYCEVGSGRPLLAISSFVQHSLDCFPF